jgi:hypothetical protein
LKDDIKFTLRDCNVMRVRDWVRSALRTLELLNPNLAYPFTERARGGANREFGECAGGEINVALAFATDWPFQALLLQGTKSTNKFNWLLP